MFKRWLWKPILIVVIAIQLGIFATSQLALWLNWYTGTPPYWDEYRPLLTWAAGQIPPDAGVAFVTPPQDTYLGDYFTLSTGLYPRTVWWMRPGPCTRLQVWCTPSNLNETDLVPLLNAYHVRYVIVSNVPGLVLPDSERMTFDQNFGLVKLGAGQE